MWIWAFSRRLRFSNNKYRHQTKQQLADDFDHLDILFTNKGDNLGPFQHLERVLDQTTAHSQDARHLHSEVRHALSFAFVPGATVVQVVGLLEMRSAAVNVIVPRHVIVRRSLARISRTVEKLRKNEEIIQLNFAEWKDCFTALGTRVRPSLRVISSF